MTKQINAQLLTGARFVYAMAVQKYRYQAQEYNWTEYAMRDTLLAYEHAKDFRSQYVWRQIKYMLRAPSEYFKAINAADQYLDWLAPAHGARAGIKYRAWQARGQWFDVTFDDALHCVKLTASTGRVYFL